MRRGRYPEGSPLNSYDRKGRFRPSRRWPNLRRWGWRIYKLKTAAPAILFFLLLVAWLLLAVRGG